jgi:hypothetical protein
MGRRILRKCLLAAVLVAGSSSCDSGGSAGPPGPQTFRLTIQGQGTGAGAVSRNSTVACIPMTTPCTSNYTQNTTVTLTALADPNSEFAGWSGGATDCISQTQASVNVTMDSNKLCTVTFNKQPEVTVAFAGNGTGSVTSIPAGINCPGTCSLFVNKGTPVALTAVAGAFSSFVDWSGAGCATSTNLLLTTVLADATCTARFNSTLTVIFDDFDDALSALARWDVVKQLDAGTSTFEANPLTGGVPLTGAYRAARHDFTAFGVTRVDHILRGDPAHPGTYDPTKPGNGPVDHLVVSMDRIVTHAPNPNAMVGTFFALRQGTRIFHAPIDPGGFFNNTNWQRHTATIRASDFVNGTPDFSAPMEFGFRRTVSASAGNLPLFLSWGTDNFRVEVHN